MEYGNPAVPRLIMRYCDRLRDVGVGVGMLATRHRTRLLRLLLATYTADDISGLYRQCSSQPLLGKLAKRYARRFLDPAVDFDTLNQPWLRFLPVSHGHPYVNMACIRTGGG